MKPFKLYSPTTVDEAAKILKDNADSAALAGGTELIHMMKQNALPQPTVLVNLKTISGLDYIKEEGGALKIGANTKLVTIASNSIVRSNYTALAQAAARVASPLIRNRGTIAGNLCQDVWCWYYKATDNLYNCIRKGGAICYAQAGDNRYYHSIFGGPRGCYAVHPSDTAVALTALDASAVTNSRTIAMKDLFQELAPGHTLQKGEIIKEIQVPTPASGSKSAFMKVAMRESPDFAIASAAVWYSLSGGTVSDARIVLGGVYQTPRRATAAESYIKGKAINEDTATAAGQQAVADATPMTRNAFKKVLAATMVKRALLA
jgi:xanthine dehydrogenase YagS FAD-binding subunit